MKKARRFNPTPESDALVERIRRETAKGAETAAVRDVLKPQERMQVRAALLRFLWNREGLIQYGRTGRVFCWLAGGHHASKDNCGIPEHDLCSFCGKSMPNQAPERWEAPWWWRR